MSSPIAGWLGDRMDNFWLLMVGGMFFSGVSLLILGPSRVVFFLAEYVLIFFNSNFTYYFIADQCGGTFVPYPF